MYLGASFGNNHPIEHCFYWYTFFQNKLQIFGILLICNLMAIFNISLGTY